MRIVRISALLLFLLGMSCKLFAQAGATGTILGTVTDSAGAVVPNATITVTNTGTKSAFQTVTNSAGDYNAPALNPGTYTVSARSTRVREGCHQLVHTDRESTRSCRPHA